MLKGWGWLPKDIHEYLMDHFLGGYCVKEKQWKGGKASPSAHAMRLVCKKWRAYQGDPARSPPPILIPAKLIFTGGMTRSRDMPFSYTRKWAGKMDVYNHLMTPHRYLSRWSDGTKRWSIIRCINRDQATYDGKPILPGPYNWKWSYFVCFRCLRRLKRRRLGNGYPKEGSHVNMHIWSPARLSDSATLIPLFPEIFEDKQRIARNPEEVVLLCDNCLDVICSDSMTLDTERSRLYMERKWMM